MSTQATQNMFLCCEDKQLMLQPQHNQIVVVAATGGKQLVYHMASHEQTSILNHISFAKNKEQESNASKEVTPPTLPRISVGTNVQGLGIREHQWSRNTSAVADKIKLFDIAFALGKE